jgi:hypothetical protein
MPAAENAAAERRYVVLRQLDVKSQWSFVCDVPATTDRQAIAAALEANPDIEQEGTFVAVPARSWRPATRRVQQVTKTSWD